MSMLFYFGITAVVCTITAFFKNTRRNRKISIAAGGIIIILIIGLRASEIGNDTSNYIKIFEACNEYGNFFAPHSRYEYGYVILMRLIGLLTDNPNIMLLIIAALTVTPFIIIIVKYSSMPWFSFALFFLCGFFFEQMNVLRQSLAMGIVLLSFHFLIKRKPIIYILGVGLASLFHTTAIIAVFFSLFAYLKADSVKFISVLIICFCVSVFMQPLLGFAALIFPQYAHYFSGSYFNGTGALASSFNIAVTFAILIVIMWGHPPFFKKRIIKSPFIKIENNAVVYDNFLTWTLVLYLGFQIIAISANIFDRIAMYLSMFQILLLPYIAGKIWDDKPKRIFVLLILLIYFIKTVIVQVLRPEWNAVIPYYFFWQ